MINKIQTLNLDKDFSPVYSQYNIGFTSLDFYSGFEPHVKLDPDSFDYDDDTVTIITGRPTNGNDLIRIFLATNAVRELKKEARVWLFLPFIPFARQDRVCVEGEPLSIKGFVSLINSQKYDRVFVYDPHSDVAPALIDNCCVIKNHWFVHDVYDYLMTSRDPNAGGLSLVSPDAGSYKKIFNTASAIGYFGNIVICDKVRDLKTGRIIQTTVNTEDLHGQDVLIVDDICDGGRTFIEIAKELKKRNSGKIFLAVTFGIFSNGFGELLTHFDMIFCTDLFKKIVNPLVNQVDVDLEFDPRYGLMTKKF
jgi:ribose-phosphate pyrophosphokinase